jgi:hypothetical protein
MFAMAASAMKAGDAYCGVVNKWPPTRRETWHAEMLECGTKWRRHAMGQGPAPVRLQRHWRALQSGSTVSTHAIREHKELVDALAEMIAAADESCKGVGLFYRNWESRFAWKAIELLNRTSSLGDMVHPSRAVVLPKIHAPRSGITLRSLTHHLALCTPGEISAEWINMPISWGIRGETPQETKSLRLLLLPWPEEVWPTQFVKVRTQLGNLPNNYGAFGYDPRPDSQVLSRAQEVIKKARRMAGRIDGVVLPEGALKVRQASKLSAETGAFVIAGVVGGRRRRTNALEVAVPLSRSARTVVWWSQSKHHRWKLDRSQIEQYCLGEQLDPNREWWEEFVIEKRSVAFWSPERWLTVCALVCEDLARPDPLGEVVRAVGPSLIVALLMDGPQLGTRWPARYATTLADDPGSSVLTLTSLGMAGLSRLPHQAKSRVVALWKDPKSGAAKEIAVPEGADGVVLSLRSIQCEEWTADGRSDGGATSYLVWDGCLDIPKGGKGRKT